MKLNYFIIIFYPYSTSSVMCNPFHRNISVIRNTYSSYIYKSGSSILKYKGIYVYLNKRNSKTLDYDTSQILS